jgi:hypothetical protein
MLALADFGRDRRDDRRGMEGNSNQITGGNVQASGSQDQV